jgi:hypothetical protein
MSEKRWTKADKIDLKFLGLITRIDLLCRIPRCTPKGGGDKWSCQCHSFSVSLPDIADQDEPVPELYPIGWVNFDRATLETKQQIRVI